MVWVSWSGRSTIQYDGIWGGGLQNLNYLNLNKSVRIRVRINRICVPAAAGESKIRPPGSSTLNIKYGLREYPDANSYSHRNLAIARDTQTNTVEYK